MTLALAAATAGIFALASVAAPTMAHATAELDRQFALESIGFLRPYDNVDFLFSDYVSDAYREYFAEQSRFKLQDLSKASDVLSKSQMPYVRLIEDVEILGQLARAMRVESVLRTKILKEGPRYRFTLQWLHAPKMDLLAEETFFLEDARDGKPLAMGDLKGRLRQALAGLVKKVPFFGMVNGRDGANVTINLGERDGVKRGDRMMIGSLDEVKRHPLLKTVVEWVITPVGKVEIDDVDQALAFGRVVEEGEDRAIGRYQKVTQIVPAPAAAAKPPLVVTEDQEREAAYQAPPKLGWGSANLWLGTGSRDYSQGTSTRKGSGLLFGAEGRGELWFTRHWFADLAFGFGTHGYSATRQDGSEVTNAGSVSLFQYELSGGYTYFATPSLLGPRAWVKMGYQSRKYSLALSAAELQAPVSFSGIFVGVGGELPLRERYGAVLNLDFGFINSASQTGGLGALSGANDVRFYLGGYWRWQPRLTVRAGVNVIANSADVAGGGAVTHRVVSIGPSLLYYF